MKTWLLSILLATIALSGCLSNDAGPGNSASNAYGIPDCETDYVDADGVNVVALDSSAYLPPTDDEGFIVNDYRTDGVWDFENTNYRSCTIEKVGHSDLREGNPFRYLGELDMRGDLDLGVVAAVGNGEMPTATLVDITDRTNPVVLSKIEHPANYITDVKISDDGDYLFLASQYSGNQVPIVETGLVSGPTAGSPHGFTIYDIRDRSNPAFVQTVQDPEGLGCHMLSHEVIDSTDVIFCIGDHVNAHGFVRTTDGTPWVYLTKFTYRLPDGSGQSSQTGEASNTAGCSNEIILVGDPADTGVFCNGPHDMTVGVDAVDGRTLMTVSHWDEGLRVVDVSAPVDDGFVTLARWNGEGATHYDGNVHTAMTFWVGDQRYVVATPEMTYDGVVPSVWVLEATDLGDGSEILDLELVGEWYHPAEYRTPGLLVTTHQWQMGPTGTDVDASDVNIYITMNHLGVWVLDFEAVLDSNLQGAIAGFHMSRAPLDPETAVSNAKLSTWDVGVVDGYIYGSDRATGLWVFDYTGDQLGDERIRGFA